MKIRWILTVSFLFLPVSCDKKDDDTGGDKSTSDDGSPTDDGMGDSGGWTDGGCGDPKFSLCCDPEEEHQAACAAATTEQECEQAQPPRGYGSCTWGEWYPTSLEGDACVYGEPQGYCLFEACQDEGCASSGTACLDKSRGFIQARMEGDTWYLAEYPEACFDRGCSWDPNTGELREGSPAVCACFCDSDFPGLG